MPAGRAPSISEAHVQRSPVGGITSNIFLRSFKKLKNSAAHPQRSVGVAFFGKVNFFFNTKVQYQVQVS